MLKEVAVTLCFIALTQAAASCPKNACDKITCGGKLTKDSCLLNGGRYIPNGGLCGCCDHCVQLLGEGEACTSSGPGLATSECGDDLYCSDTIKPVH
ncbi:hypothetical protein EB796_007306 [Bugula neritina]|uniref:CRIM1 n=1 Tax=Bugula neritina TaxID=10212 RepID=A0A7J7K867_BUGNE|nr:hypothetical protein EB796_007306 [Bugula neritina]